MTHNFTLLCLEEKLYESQRQDEQFTMEPGCAACLRPDDLGRAECVDAGSDRSAEAEGFGILSQAARQSQPRADQDRVAVGRLVAHQSFAAVELLRHFVARRQPVL